MELKFDYEYDGTVYLVEVEYRAVDASYDDEYGTVKAAYADPVSYTTYVNGAQVILTDKKLTALLWSQADLEANKALARWSSSADYAI